MAASELNTGRRFDSACVNRGDRSDRGAYRHEVHEGDEANRGALDATFDAERLESS